MPFISKDWRSPGEAWVKLEDGNWEKLKVLECGKRKRIPSTSEDDENTDVTVPPHCHITIRNTKEIAGFNGLGDAVQRLDFRSSVRDRRRFHYICTLLGLIVTGKGIASLPGSAQRLLLQMVEEVASHVSDSQQNINILRGLVIQLQQIVNQENQKCWGKPLGSQNLWLEHKQTIERIQAMTNQIQITVPDASIRPRMTDLPEECIREIILRIADYRDLEATSKAWNVMSALVNEQRIWRELTGFHFNKNQLNFILDKKKSRIITSDVKDWKKVFHDLRKAYGERDDHQFIEILSLCRFCCCLFWPSDGHPCIIDQCPDLKQRLTEAGENVKLSQPVPPAQFLKFFSL